MRLKHVWSYIPLPAYAKTFVGGFEMIITSSSLTITFLVGPHHILSPDGYLSYIFNYPFLHTTCSTEQGLRYQRRRVQCR
jgi:hypothetical protein